MNVHVHIVTLLLHGVEFYFFLNIMHLYFSCDITIKMLTC